MLDPPIVIPHRALRAVFVFHGAIIATWIPFIPVLKDRLNIDKAALGLVLLFGAVGSVSAMATAGRMMSRISPTTGARLGAAGMALATIVLVNAQTLPWMILALTFFGFAVGLLDVSMNALATALQDRAGRRILSALHGWWSVGGLVASFAASAVFRTGAVTAWAFAGPLIELALVSRWLIRLPSSVRRPVGQPGHGLGIRRVLPIGIILFAALLAEGSVYDWGAVFLTESRGADLSVAAFALGVFSTAMAVSRLGGDRVTMRLGSVRTAIGGLVLTAAGAAVAASSAGVAGAAAGFTLMGVGIANLVPLAFAAAGSADPGQAAAGIGSVSMIGFLAFFIGPPAIGAISQAGSLAAAYIVIGVLGLLAIPFTRSLAPGS